MCHIYRPSLLSLLITLVLGLKYVNDTIKPFPFFFIFQKKMSRHMPTMPNGSFAPDAPPPIFAHQGFCRKESCKALPKDDTPPYTKQQDQTALTEMQCMLH